MKQPRHVYVHVPFCSRRCAYCDFAIAVRRTVPVEEYAAALEHELSLRFPARDASELDTLYFGGGTPSRLGGDGVRRVMDVLRAHFTTAPGAEITLEANPEDITPEAVAAWRDAGINRLSIGSQSFDDRILTWMHRTHDADAIPRAVEAARAGGFDNFSLDLIFALPEHTERSWERDVAQALALEPTHLSLYGLTIEPHTPLGRWHGRGDVIESPEEKYESEFLHAHRALTTAGFEHYEVSNFARPGFRSRHNSSYWQNVAYAGLGPSAHEFDGSVRRWNVKPYAEWVSRLGGGQDPIDGCETLDAGNRVAEEVYLGLRTTDGLVVTEAELDRAGRWVDSGWARVDAERRLILTPLGWLRLDSLAADLTHVRSHY